MSDDHHTHSTGTVGSGPFITTRWTQVLDARGDSPEARKALGALCEAYWHPVYTFIRRERGDDETARDLSQEFFSRLLARPGFGAVNPGQGRFRSYLLGAVKHFLADERAHAQAAKRGGGKSPLSLDSESADEARAALQVADPAGPAPDTTFDREWALTLVQRSIAALAAECAAAGKTRQFDVLKPWLLGEWEGLSQAEAARQLDLTEGAVKVAIHRLRKRFREWVKSEIAQTVGESAVVKEELSYLLEVLCAERAR